MVIYLERGADLHTAQLMPLPLAYVKSRLVLPFSYWVMVLLVLPFWYWVMVLAYPGSPGKRAVKWVCVCIYMVQYFLSQICFTG